MNVEQFRTIVDPDPLRLSVHVEDEKSASEKPDLPERAKPMGARSLANKSTRLVTILYSPGHPSFSDYYPGQADEPIKPLPAPRPPGPVLLAWPSSGKVQRRTRCQSFRVFRGHGTP